MLSEETTCINQCCYNTENVKAEDSTSWNPVSKWIIQQSYREGRCMPVNYSHLDKLQLQRTLELHQSLSWHYPIERISKIRIVQSLPSTSKSVVQYVLWVLNPESLGWGSRTGLCFDNSDLQRKLLSYMPLQNERRLYDHMIDRGGFSVSQSLPWPCNDSPF